MMASSSETWPRCGVLHEADGATTWRVWAPLARAVELALWDAAGQMSAVPMTAEDRGCYAHTARDVPEGQRYAYRLNGSDPRPDPLSQWQPDGVHRPSAVLRPEQFSWSEGDWTGLRRQDLVIYELHVGTFTPEGTFAAIIPRLRSLLELGITAIELLPVAQFPGARGWGYDGVHVAATQNSYGGPHGLQQLINACHAAGMAVILDVVYNHIGPEGNYLGSFGPYFTDKYQTPWGRAVNFDDAGSDFVRAFVLENVRQWIGDFRLDGLRLDAIHAIYDFSPRHILAEIKQTADDAAWKHSRRPLIIAESSLNDVRLLDPPAEGGFALDGQWSDDFHHCVHTLFTGEREGYYSDFGDVRQLATALNQTFVYDGSYSPYRQRRHGVPAGKHTGDKFVISVQNHDQVGNRAIGDRFGTLLTPAQQRLAAGLMLLAPHVPLLFMGEEYGETQPFPFFVSFEDPHLVEAVRRGRREEYKDFTWAGEVPDPQAEETFRSAQLSWSWPEGSWHAGLRRLYQDLLKARRDWPALQNFEKRKAEFIGQDPPESVLRLSRGGTPGFLRTGLTAYFNLTDREQSYPAHAIEGDVLRLSSEEAHYAGEGSQPGRLRPFEFQVFGPPVASR